MNGYEMEDLESLVGILESDESDESDEMAERRFFGRRPNPRTASGRNLSPAMRPQGNYVTQVQLQTALAKVGEQIQTNSKAIATVNTRLNTAAAEQAKQATALKKETGERKKQDEVLKRDVRQKVEMLALLPALSRPRSEEITVPTAPPPGQTTPGSKTVKVLTESDDTLGLLLPLLLIGGGLGGSSGSGASGNDGGSDSNSLLLVLALSGALGGKK